MIAFRGATAYEVQIGRFWVKWVHLRGGHWKRRFQLDRLSFGLEKR